MKIKKASFFKYIIFTSKASMIFILSITLMSIGILIFTLFSLQRGINILQENIPAKIILNSQYSNSELLLLNNYLELELKGKEAKNSLFVSREEGLEQMYTLLGDDLREFFGQDQKIQNPLPDIRNIYLLAEYHNVEYLNKIEKDIEDNFVCVSYFQQPVNVMMINAYKFNILLGSAIFSIIFFMISVLLIYNNIRLSIYNERINIKAMQLVGATKSFIQRPFIKRSLWVGIQSGIIALIFLSLLWYVCYLYFPILYTLINSYEVIQFCIVIVFLGILISFISTFIVLRKITSLKTDLYE